MLFVFVLSGSTRDFIDYELSTYWSLNLHGHFDSAQYGERCAFQACSQPSKDEIWAWRQAAGAFAINDHQIDDVSSFPYFGSIVTPTNNLDAEMNSELGWHEGSSLDWPEGCGGSVAFIEGRRLKSSMLWWHALSSMPQLRGHKENMQKKKTKKNWDCSVQNGSFYARCETHRPCQNDYRLWNLGNGTK